MSTESIAWKGESQQWGTVRRLMREQKLSNQQLADAIGVSLATANGAMAGKRFHMTTTELAKLCVFLGVSPSDIEPALLGMDGAELTRLREFKADVDKAYSRKI